MAMTAVTVDEVVFALLEDAGNPHRDGFLPAVNVAEPADLRFRRTVGQLAAFGVFLHGALFEAAEEVTRRLSAMFLRDAQGNRPVYGGTAKFQQDPHWRDLILFYEYFHGDNGAGLGASHQTGWTGVIASLLDLFGRVDAKALLEIDRERLQTQITRAQVGGEKVGA